MKLVVGRDPTRANVHVPPQYVAVGPAHAVITPDPSGVFLLEDLASQNGTFFFDGTGWQRVAAAHVYITTPILLGDFRTTVAELLAGLATPPVPSSPAATAVLPLASAAQTPVQPDGGPAAAEESLGRLPFALLLRTIGVDDLLRILSTLHAPLRGIRALVAEPNKALYQAIIAYVALVAMIPFLHKEVIMRLGTLVNYPVVAQGAAIEDAMVLNIVSAISGTLGFLLMYALPASLYRPSTKNLVIASNIYVSLYVLIYSTCADLLKFAQYAVTRTFEYSIVIGLLVMLGGLVFQVFVWRRVLQLRWLPIVVFMIIGLTFGFLHGYVLGWLGLIKYAGVGG